MNRRRRTRRGCGFLPLFVFALILAFPFVAPELKERFGWGADATPGRSAGDPVFSELRSGWTRYENCRFLADEYYDGDSFMAQTKTGKRIVFRLYFVDAPETDDRYPKRNREQAEWFGVKDVIPIGEKSKRFTRSFLKRGFTATTRHERAAGMSGLPRSYAFIEVKGELLSEALLKEGLARPYGRDTDLPDGTKKAVHWQRINRLGGK